MLALWYSQDHVSIKYRGPIKKKVTKDSSTLSTTCTQCKQLTTKPIIQNHALTGGQLVG